MKYHLKRFYCYGKHKSNWIICRLGCHKSLKFTKSFIPRSATRRYIQLNTQTARLGPNLVNSIYGNLSDWKFREGYVKSFNWTSGKHNSSLRALGNKITQNMFISRSLSIDHRANSKANRLIVRAKRPQFFHVREFCLPSLVSCWAESRDTDLLWGRLQ